MVVGEVTLHFPNSIVIIGDPAGSPPGSIQRGIIASTSSVVALGTVAEMDGAAHLSLAMSPDNPSARPSLSLFDGSLELPSRRLTVESARGEVFLSQPVAESPIRVRVWVDDPDEPRDICVVVG